MGNDFFQKELFGLFLFLLKHFYFSFHYSSYLTIMSYLSAAIAEEDCFSSALLSAAEWVLGGLDSCLSS